MISTLAFIFALSFLILIHEYGHYRVAKACGVKVVRFSIGFGKPLLAWRRGKDQTEFVLAPFPFGGYVRMLDSKVDDVPQQELHRAFDQQKLRKRVLVVLAGPVANFLLAIILYAAILFFNGMEEGVAKFDAPISGSMAEVAGMQMGDTVTDFALTGKASKPVVSANALYKRLNAAASKKEDVELTVKRQNGAEKTIKLPLSQLKTEDNAQKIMAQIGFGGPWSSPSIRKVFADGAAARAGLKDGDLILSVDGDGIRNVVDLFAKLEKQAAEQPSHWIIKREGQELNLTVTADSIKRPAITLLTDTDVAASAGFHEGDIVIAVEGRLVSTPAEVEERLSSAQQHTNQKVSWIVQREGRQMEVLTSPNVTPYITERFTAKIGVSFSPDLVKVQYGFFESVQQGVERTLFVSRMILTSIANMIVGDAKVKDNLGGPIEIFNQIGGAAEAGMVSYLSYLAFISISLFILNLLPLPVLDGGHLLFYIIEGLRGKPLADVWIGYFQRLGIILLVGFMLFVSINDITRLVSG